MNKRKLLLVSTIAVLALLILALISTTSAMAQGGTPTRTPVPTPTRTPVPTFTPQTTVGEEELVEEGTAQTTDLGILPLFVNEPDRHFQKAAEAFQQKDMKTAATEIRKVAAFLRVETGRAAAPRKVVLMASVRELDRVAGLVEKGVFTSVDELNLTFARAEYALAKHHELQAKEAWGKAEIDARMAGRDLDAAVTSFEAGEAWLGGTPKANVSQNARLVALKLIESKWERNEVGKALQAVSQEIKNLKSMTTRLQAEETDLVTEFEGEDVAGIAFVHPFKPREARQLERLEEFQDFEAFEAGIVPLLADEPEQHFQTAFADFNKKDAKAAASEIRHGAAFLSLSAGRATAQEKDLKASIHELDVLARKVDKGTVISTDELAIGFARAQYALARHHELKARDFWVRSEVESRLAGEDLNATIVHLEHADARVGHSVNAAAISAGRLLASHLREGSGYVAETVGSGIDAIGTELVKLSESILFTETQVDEAQP